MKKVISLTLVLSVLSVTIFGCAAIIHGTKQKIPVNSSPSGAKVIVMGAHKASTPAVIELSRSESNIVLRFEKDGYEPVDVAITRSVDGWIVGNIIFGGIIGLVVDFASGAAYKLTPNEVSVNLQKQEALLQNNFNENELVVFFEIE